MNDTPIVWKKENCIAGECKGANLKHFWSIPWTTSGGLVTECYFCGKTRFVEIDR